MSGTTPHELRAEADRLGEEFVDKLTDLLNTLGLDTHDALGKHVDTIVELDKIFGELRSMEYESGFATGYDGGYAVGHRDGKRKA